MLIALPILVLWAFASGITAWLNAPPKQAKPKLTTDEDRFLRQLALRTWRFFYQFGGESHNYLIPDNVEEEGLFEAARVSPTNFGLLLNARQAAVTFGYLSVPEFITLSKRSLETYDKLDKFRGHIYNWYDTRTLEPIRPITISSVDSGNLAASFYTLRSGARGLLREPLLHPAQFSGIRDHWQLLDSLEGASSSLKKLEPPAEDASADAWIAWALTTVDAPEFALGCGCTGRGFVVVGRNAQTRPCVRGHCRELHAVATAPICAVACFAPVARRERSRSYGPSGNGRRFRRGS